MNLNFRELRANLRKYLSLRYKHLITDKTLSYIKHAVTTAFIYSRLYSSHSWSIHPHRQTTRRKAMRWSVFLCSRHCILNADSTKTHSSSVLYSVFCWLEIVLSVVERKRNYGLVLL